MSLLHTRYPGLDLGHLKLGTRPTPVRPLELDGIDGVALWMKDESVFGDGGWGGNKVRKLEWILPEAKRRGVRTLFTVGGIGTHWGLACARYGAAHGFRTVLGLVDQPVDDHVREQLARLESSGAELHRYPSPARLKLAAPWLMTRHLRDWRLPWYLPAGGSNEFGTLGYVETALEIATQVAKGELPEPGTVVVPVGSGGTVAGLALGFRLAGLDTKVLGVVVNDALDLSTGALYGLAERTATLLVSRGAGASPALTADCITVKDNWLGRTYGDPTPAAQRMVAAGAKAGLELEPVYTGKALAAIADIGTQLEGPLLWLNTHGPR